MLARLFIQNYVIIDALEIQFDGRMNVITGETGAGKSIIVGALGLILGERADASALVNKEKKSVIEGFFAVAGKVAVKEFLTRYELDDHTELSIRREITSNGKSRAFINDTPVNLSQLQELGSLLVDLHQQFDTLELATRDFQREVIDAMAGHSPVLKEYRLLFDQWKQSQKETTALQQQQQQLEKEADYNRFQYQELEEAGFRENELEETEVELKMLNNAEGIKAALSRVYDALSEGESPIVQQLRSLQQQLNSFASYHSALPALLERMQSAQVELQDISADLEQIGHKVIYDPQRIDTLNERLSVGYKLQKKHGVNSTSALLAIQEELNGKLQTVIQLHDRIQQKEKATAVLYENALKLAAKLSAGRKKKIKPLEDQVNQLLVQVGMPNARLKVALKEESDLNPNGQDEIGFLFDANKSGQFSPVHKVASGGELSRLMLCIKSLVAQSMDLPTLIFDEIDTGISGEAARQVGIIMKELAGSRQVICITHQPQIAGKADAHYFVYKEIVKDQVKTNIRALSTDERITAIAKMLSGEKPTAAALENAREMIMN